MVDDDDEAPHSSPTGRKSILMRNFPRKNERRVPGVGHGEMLTEGELSKRRVPRMGIRRSLPKTFPSVFSFFVDQKGLRMTSGRVTTPHRG